MIALWVGLGAAVGAPLRYLTDRAVQLRFVTKYPAGTLLVNLVAALLLGVLTGLSGLDSSAAALVGTGFCGALSTWSTFAFEAVGLLGARRRLVAAGYVTASVVAGVGLAALGWAVGAAAG